jgi:RNA polymerase sigma-70 factor (ECF subfamily)
MATDLELLDRARTGDQRATNQLLERHELRVYRFGLRMCGNDDDAREILQETLLAAFKNLHTFRGDAALSTWLFQIARSFCIKRRRRREGEPQRHESVETAEVLSVPSGEPQSDARHHDAELAVLIQAAIGTLPTEQREAIVLRDVEGLSADEAAEVVGIEVGALKSRLHRARTALREQLAAALTEREDSVACPELAEELTQYAAAEIDQATCVRIEAHLARCPRCTAACDALKRTVSMCRAIPGGEVPLPVQAAVRKALRQSAVG